MNFKQKIKVKNIQQKRPHRNHQLHFKAILITKIVETKPSRKLQIKLICIINNSEKKNSTKKNSYLILVRK